MLIVLKNFLKLCGLYSFDRVRYCSANAVKMLTNSFAIGSMGFFCTSSIIYSLKHQDIISAIKSAGYSYNNVLTMCVSYIYLLITRDELWCLIENWETTVQNSSVKSHHSMNHREFNSIFFFKFRNQQTTNHFELLWKQETGNRTASSSHPIYCFPCIWNILSFWRIHANRLFDNGQLWSNNLACDLWSISVRFFFNWKNIQILSTHQMNRFVAYKMPNVFSSKAFYSVIIHSLNISGDWFVWAV